MFTAFGLCPVNGHYQDGSGSLFFTPFHQLFIHTEVSSRLTSPTSQPVLATGLSGPTLHLNQCACAGDHRTVPSTQICLSSAEVKDSLPCLLGSLLLMQPWPPMPQSHFTGTWSAASLHGSPVPSLQQGFQQRVHQHIILPGVPAGAGLCISSD